MLKVSAWSLATKLSVSFCLVVFVLMAGVTAHSLRSAEESQLREERETLQDLAGTTAGRLDQLIIDSKQRVEVLSGDNELETMMSWPADRRMAAIHAMTAGSRDGDAARRGDCSPKFPNLPSVDLAARGGRAPDTALPAR